MSTQEKIVYNVDFGMEAQGKVVELNDGTFQAYEIPLFGGEWIIVGHPSKPFKTREEAIQCLNSLT